MELRAQGRAAAHRRPRTSARHRAPPGELGQSDRRKSAAPSPTSPALHPELEVLFPVHLNPVVQAPVHAILGACPNVRLVPPLDYLAHAAGARRRLAGADRLRRTAGRGADLRRAAAGAARGNRASGGRRKPGCAALVGTDRDAHRRRSRAPVARRAGLPPDADAPAIRSATAPRRSGSSPRSSGIFRHATPTPASSRPEERLMWWVDIFATYLYALKFIAITSGGADADQRHWTT